MVFFCSELDKEKDNWNFPITLVLPVYAKLEHEEKLHLNQMKAAQLKPREI